MRITLDMAPRRMKGVGYGLNVSQPLPACLVMLVLLGLQADGGLSGRAVLQSAIAISAVFALARLRIASMPPLAAFLIGLWQDLLGITPLGVGALTMLLLQLVAHRSADRRRLGSGLLKSWALFVPSAALAVMLMWGLVCAIDRHLLPLITPMRQCVLSIAMFPILASLFDPASRWSMHRSNGRTNRFP